MAAFNLAKTRTFSRNIIGHCAIINVLGQRGDNVVVVTGHTIFIALTPPKTEFDRSVMSFADYRGGDLTSYQTTL